MMMWKIGAPEEIRTPSLLIRSQMLYPVELRAHMKAGKLAKKTAKGKAFILKGLKSLFNPIY
jgi:hypothetical protein